MSGGAATGGGSALGRRARLAKALARSRLEVIPLGRIERTVRESVPGGTLLTITSSPGKGVDATLDLAERLSAEGYPVVPHLAARTVAGRDHLEEILGRLRAMGVGRLFVIGGDGREPRGPYPSALSLLEAMADVGHHLQDIGIGGYPEGHPLISDDALMDALAEKQRFAHHIATQICFDPDAIGAWLARVRERGIRLPVFVGMAGAVHPRKLVEVSLRVGVGPSVKFVSKHGGLVARLMRRGGYRPDEFISRIGPLADDPMSDIHGFHVFTFNQVESTERWRRGLMERLAGGGPPGAASDAVAGSDTDEESDTAS
jgi:methylenetetrahydrofolate reductase (NADPH)